MDAMPQGGPPQTPAPDPMQAIQAQLDALQAQPTWDDAKALMANDGARTFRVDIETDSTIAGDLQAEQQGMAELLGGIAQFVTSFGPAVAQGFIPMDAAKAMLMAAVRRFKMGKTVEDALDQIPEGQPPQQQAEKGDNDDQVKLAQQEMIEETRRQQIAADQAIKNRELDLKQQDQEADAQNSADELDLRRREVELAERKFAVEMQPHIEARDAADMAGQHAQAAAQLANQMGGMMQQLAQMHQATQAIAAQHAQHVTDTAQHLTGLIAAMQQQRPRKVNFIRDKKTNRLIGAEIGE